MSGTNHLYIHIPFCRSRCDYCDFFSTVYAAGSAKPYLRELEAELEDCKHLLGPLDTVYIGGGTPSLMGREFLCSLLERLEALTAGDAEVTVEANPESFDLSLAKDLAAGGVTRVSLGAQSFKPELRLRIGRRGEVKAIESAVAAVRDAGIDQLNLDVLFALPGQTGAELEDDLRRAVALAPDHISCYELTAKPGSGFSRRRRLELENAESDAGSFYRLVSDRLEAAGYRWYETSNYAIDGRECRHNLAYWRGADYVGIGAGAWSTVGTRRWRNVEDLDAYIDDRTGKRYREELAGGQKRFEAVMLALRTSAGSDMERAAGSIDRSQLEVLRENGFVESDGARIRLTRAGRYVANEVCARLLRSP